MPSNIHVHALCVLYTLISVIEVPPIKRICVSAIRSVSLRACACKRCAHAGARCAAESMCCMRQVSCMCWVTLSRS